MPGYLLRSFAIAAALGALACQAKDNPTPPAAENLLRITASDFAFDAPEQIPGGVTTIRVVNRGPSFHHLQLLELNDGKTLADFLGGMKGDGPPPPWVAFVGGPNAPSPGDSSTAVITLEPGNYALICLIPDSTGAPHFTKGMAHPLTVTAPASASAEPAADDTIKLNEYGFELARPLTAGHHTIRVENAGQQAHEMLLVRLDPGKTAMDIADWAHTMKGTPPGTPIGGTTGMAPGAHNLVVADLTAGDYGLLCFFPDAKDGKPHVVHGMALTIKVS